jgi:transposase-like protein
MPKRRRKEAYTKQEKEAAIKAYLSEGLKKASQSTGISPSTISYWARKKKRKSIRKIIQSTKDQDLLKELAELRRERDMYKKCLDILMSKLK